MEALRSDQSREGFRPHRAGPLAGVAAGWLGVLRGLGRGGRRSCRTGRKTATGSRRSRKTRCRRTGSTPPPCRRTIKSSPAGGGKARSRSGASRMAPSCGPSCRAETSDEKGASECVDFRSRGRPLLLAIPGTTIGQVAPPMIRSSKPIGAAPGDAVALETRGSDVKDGGVDPVRRPENPGSRVIEIGKAEGERLADDQGGRSPSPPTSRRGRSGFASSAKGGVLEPGRTADRQADPDDRRVGAERQAEEAASRGDPGRD